MCASFFSASLPSPRLHEPTDERTVPLGAASPAGQPSSAKAADSSMAHRVSLSAGLSRPLRCAPLLSSQLHRSATAVTAPSSRAVDGHSSSPVAAESPSALCCAPFLHSLFRSHLSTFVVVIHHRHELGACAGAGLHRLVHHLSGEIHTGHAMTRGRTQSVIDASSSHVGVFACRAVCSCCRC